MKTFTLVGAAIAAMMLVSGAANATAYNFVVDYSGSEVAALAAGSDDPLATTLLAGDSFTYTLQATNGGHWNTISDGAIFPFFALSVSECGTRTGDMSLSLNNGAASVFSTSENGISNSCAHVGTNTVALTNGLQFDKFVMTYSLLTAVDSGDNTLAIGSTSTSLLPWPGQSPEMYSPSVISYTAGTGGVPEPASWALMIAGFGLAGATLRRRRTLAA